MEDVVTASFEAYRGKRVLVTGHTGFKGGWLSVWLNALGARVVGLSLAPEPHASFFESIGVAAICEHNVGDIRDRDTLGKLIERAEPEVVFHLAAQPLVRMSYEDPLATLATNVMGTANLLDAIRESGRPCSVVVVTSDKCYENREWVHGYREDDPMGGHDVYSMSKGACELLVASFRRSFFSGLDARVAIASARAGNVIGGGDWAKDRIIPDAVRSLQRGEPVPVRNPQAVRPWQHVLEPLSGYLVLGARLLAGDMSVRSGWNFGPRSDETHPVGAMMDTFVRLWGEGGWRDVSSGSTVHEAGLLRLSVDKAFAQLGWRPRWTLEQALEHTITWYKLHAQTRREELLALTIEQIRAYERAMHA